MEATDVTSAGTPPFVPPRLSAPALWWLRWNIFASRWPGLRDAVALAARANRRLLADIADDWRVETRRVAPTEDEIDDDLRRRASRLAARIDALPAVAERDDAFARFARALARSSANS